MTTPKLFPPNFNFDDIEILKIVNQANIALAELNGLIYALPSYELLLQPLTVREAVASSEIENIRTTTLDILQAELAENSNMLSKDQKETLRYKEALLYGYNLVKKNGFISTNLTVEVQKILEPDKFGIRNQMGTIIADGYGNVIHTPPQTENEVRELMAGLDSFINTDSDDVDPLIKMALYHHQFETIHPFFDGNGRSGRIMMVLYLYITNRLRYPVLFLSGYILKNKLKYYSLLQSVRTDDNWKEWVIFILNGVIEQAKDSSNKVKAMSDLKKRWKRILKTDFPKIYSVEVLDYLFSKAFYTQTNMSAATGMSRQTAAKYFDQLIEAGLMNQKQVGRERLYFINEFVSLLS